MCVCICVCVCVWRGGGGGGYSEFFLLHRLGLFSFVGAVGVVRRAFMRTEFLCIYVLRVASGPRVKLVSCKSALTPHPHPGGLLYRSF